MNGKIANPKALGFGVLAIALWMFSVVHAGIADPMGIDPGVMHMVGTVAMLGLLIAGIASFLRHESWLGFFFLLWSGLFWGAGHGMGHGQMGYGDMRYAGWFMMTIALVNFYLWFAAMKSGRLGHAVSFMVLLLWLSFLALGLRGFFDFWVLIRVGGALGLASALVAFYVSAGAIAAEHCPDLKLPGIVREQQSTTT
ncbi:MAG: hypothetical protein ACREPH_02995 [Rhodanobacteraceae bacterium]